MTPLARAAYQAYKAWDERPGDEHRAKACVEALERLAEAQGMTEVALRIWIPHRRHGGASLRQIFEEVDAA